MIKQLNPGSDEAIKAGCTCPVMDNYYGKGIGKDKSGETLFWYDGECPIHTPQTTKKKVVK